MIGMMPLYIVLRAVGMIRGDAVDQPAVARNNSSMRNGCARVVRVFSILTVLEAYRVSSHTYLVTVNKVVSIGITIPFRVSKSSQAGIRMVVLL